MKESPLVHLFLLPLYAIVCASLLAAGFVLYDAVATASHPLAVVGIIVGAAWLTLILFAAPSQR
jgi:hypothetical protein